MGENNYPGIVSYEFKTKFSGRSRIFAFNGETLYKLKLPPSQTWAGSAVFANAALLFLFLYRAYAGAVSSPCGCGSLLRRPLLSFPPASEQSRKFGVVIMKKGSSFLVEELYFLTRGEAAGTAGKGVVPREGEEDLPRKQGQHGE